jgi:hypothetical protein
MAIIAVGHPAGAVTQRGRLEVMNSSGTAPLNSGGSATVFTLRPPANAACPGDSQHHEYQVNSYVEPVSRPLDQVTFVGLGYPNVGLDLIDTGGTPFVSQATAVDTGALPAIPPLSWSRYDHDSQDLTPGTYDVGLVCAKPQGVPTYYWNTKIAFASSSTDPGGFTWSVVTPYRGHNPSSRAYFAAAVVAALAIVIAAALILVSRRSRPEVVTPRRNGRQDQRTTASRQP